MVCSLYWTDGRLALTPRLRGRGGPADRPSTSSERAALRTTRHSVRCLQRGALVQADHGRGGVQMGAALWLRPTTLSVSVNKKAGGGGPERMGGRDQRAGVVAGRKHWGRAVGPVFGTQVPKTARPPKEEGLMAEARRARWRAAHVTWGAEGTTARYTPLSGHSPMVTKPLTIFRPRVVSIHPVESTATAMNVVLAAPSHLTTDGDMSSLMRCDTGLSSAAIPFTVHECSGAGCWPGTGPGRWHAGWRVGDLEEAQRLGDGHPAGTRGRLRRGSGRRSRPPH